jgi:hypothetical protein
MRILADALVTEAVIATCADDLLLSNVHRPSRVRSTHAMWGLQNVSDQRPFAKTHVKCCSQNCHSKSDFQEHPKGFKVALPICTFDTLRASTST